MNEQARITATSLPGPVGGSMMKEDRYYVQRLTEQVFVIRERLCVDGKPRPHDRIVRSFDVSHDAHMYADKVNERQRKLDEDYGHWTQHAIEER